MCTKWGVAQDSKLGSVLYLTDVLRLRLELPDVRAAIKAEDRADRPALIILDERGVGLGVYQDLRRDGYRHVQGSTATSEALPVAGSEAGPNCSKVDRFGQAALVIDDGEVLRFPTKPPGWRRFCMRWRPSRASPTRTRWTRWPSSSPTWTWALRMARIFGPSRPSY